MSARPGLCGGYHASAIPTAIVLPTGHFALWQFFINLMAVWIGLGSLTHCFKAVDVDFSGIAIQTFMFALQPYVTSCTTEPISALSNISTPGFSP
jgi:hypothetical protein